MRAGGRILSRRGEEFFVDESDDEGNEDMVGVVGVSKGSFLFGCSKLVDMVGAGGSSFARGGTVTNCELLPDGVRDPDVFSAGG